MATWIYFVMGVPLLATLALGLGLWFCHEAKAKNPHQEIRHQGLLTGLFIGCVIVDLVAASVTAYLHEWVISSTLAGVAALVTLMTYVFWTFTGPFEGIEEADIR